MKEELNYIWRRRSIREFSEQPLTGEHFRELLEAAMAAPSARHCDPWEFIIVNEKEILQKLAVILPNGPFLNHCGGAIIVCGDLEKAYMNSLSYLLQDCTAAMENILLAAPALGLGSCWLGIHPREERMQGIRELFSIPANIIPTGACALGFPAVETVSRTRFDQNKIHTGAWIKKG